MSDEAQTNLAYPCDMCHASVGEPCDPGCPSLIGTTPDPYWAGEVIGTPAEWTDGTDEVDTEDAKTRLMRAVWRLPYGGICGDVPDRALMNEAEWLDRLAGWMTEYEQVSRLAIAELQADARRAMVLQFQKDSARAWLGVGA